jgi:hypothetical protein
MSKVSGFTRFFIAGAVATVLSACDVQVHDATPDQYPANHDAGMYEIKATVSADSMASPGSLFLFGLSGQQRIEMSPNRDGTEWRGMYAIRCHSSFPLQLKAIWRPQGVTTREKVVPEGAPREIKLIEPEPTKEASIDTSGKSPKGGWTGSVKYRFSTQPDTQITGAHIEPTTQDPADVNAAKGITVSSQLPVDAQCGTPTEVDLTTTAQNAHGNLVIDTNLPAYPHWTTRVEFAPKSP